MITPVTSTVLPPCGGAAAPSVFVGIDGGFSGAIAAIDAHGRVAVAPAVVQDLGRSRVLAVRENRELLQGLIRQLQAQPAQTLVTYEQAQLNPKFGYRNNYVNGANNEFWRIMLSLEQLPFQLVNPRTWQSYLFAGVRGDDTGAMAALVCQQRFPALDLRGYSKAQREGIYDALLIALWGRAHH